MKKCSRKIPQSTHFLSRRSSDGKEAVAKAANFHFEKHYSSASNLKEFDMAEALMSIGCGGTEPNLMLIYGFAQCHLGFPAWRMNYTEIVHMGSLMSMNFGSLVKVIHRFTMVRQNYGTWTYILSGVFFYNMYKMYISR